MVMTPLRQHLLEILKEKGLRRLDVPIEASHVRFGLSVEVPVGGQEEGGQRVVREDLAVFATAGRDDESHACRRDPGRQRDLYGRCFGYRSADLPMAAQWRPDQWGHEHYA